MAMPYPSPDGNVEPALNGANLNIPKAGQACLSCRRQKRRCDKKLPACSLCERMNRACDYSDASPAPTAEDFNALRAKLIELETRLLQHNQEASLNGPSQYQPTPQSNSLSSPSHIAQQSPAPNFAIAPQFQTVPVQNRFPVIAFLDAESFQNGRIEVPIPQIDIPIEVLEQLGDPNAVLTIVNEFFDTVHTWLPFVSKKRLQRNAFNPMWEAGPDLALLFLCMKLTSSRPQEGVEHSHAPIYTAAKRFIATLEAGGFVSLTMLQNYLLIAIYEIGHSIYPAAWMTAGNCVRYGQLLGLHDSDRGPRLLPPATTWTEMEERRRAWWTVIIIDRIVAMGSVGKFGTSEDPDVNVALPGPTAAWDEGHLSNEPSHTLANLGLGPLPPFARLCQTVVLAGRVLRHHRQKAAPASQFAKASALYLELLELARLLMHEASTSEDYLSLATPMAVCFSALCGLCDPYACHSMHTAQTSPEEATMQLQAIEGLRSVSASIQDLAVRIEAYLQQDERAMERMGPFVLDAFYCGASNFAWDVRESGNGTAEEGLESIGRCLQRFTGRWRVAGEYGRILEAQEFTYAVGAA